MKIHKPEMKVETNRDGEVSLVYRFDVHRTSEIKCKSLYQAEQIELALRRMYTEGAEAARQEILARIDYHM